MRFWRKLSRTQWTIVIALTAMILSLVGIIISDRANQHTDDAVKALGRAQARACAQAAALPANRHESLEVALSTGLIADCPQAALASPSLLSVHGDNSWYTYENAAVKFNGITDADVRLRIENGHLVAHLPPVVADTRPRDHLNITLDLMLDIDPGYRPTTPLYVPEVPGTGPDDKPTQPITVIPATGHPIGEYVFPRLVMSLPDNTSAYISPARLGHDTNGRQYLARWYPFSPTATTHGLIQVTRHGDRLLACPQAKPKISTKPYETVRDEVVFWIDYTSPTC